MSFVDKPLFTVKKIANVCKWEDLTLVIGLFVVMCQDMWVYFNEKNYSILYCLKWK